MVALCGCGHGDMLWHRCYESLWVWRAMCTRYGLGIFKKSTVVSKVVMAMKTAVFGGYRHVFVQEKSLIEAKKVRCDARFLLKVHDVSMQLRCI